ncbi:MAG: DUF512 domain-containing protein [Phascolarctobacterium sp.]|nr:DUF512 domain-containing protein [Phascolarctobacterium sp.]
MKGIISGIRRHSLAEKHGIRVGEKLCRINGSEVKDILDFSFRATDSLVELEIEDESGKKRAVLIEKYPDEYLGLEFESAIFNEISTCRNRCIFCFVDQMIPGMRKSLYIRDDDYRLSFLSGNFITLTNMQDEDFDYVIRMHMSPLYVSVHVTDPAVRSKMMGSSAAEGLMEKLVRLADAGIRIHTQVVCCPGYNEGNVLEKTFKDLYALNPKILTMAVVPVGLTKNRKRLFPLRTFTKEEAGAIVDIVTEWQKKCRKDTGRSFVHLGDEFYLLADKKIPATSWYDGFPQLENGIGLTRMFLDEWSSTLKKLRHAKAADETVIPIGEGAANILGPLMESFNKTFHGNHSFLPVPNKFFGGGVNVTGLLTGRNILAAVPEKRRLVLPSMVLNNDGLFLDDMSLEDFRKRYQGKVQIAKNAEELLTLLTISREE